MQISLMFVVPPMMIFPRSFLIVASDGTLDVRQQSGWMTIDISEMDKTFSRFC